MCTNIFVYHKNATISKKKKKSFFVVPQRCTKIKQRTSSNSHFNSFSRKPNGGEKNSGKNKIHILAYCLSLSLWKNSVGKDVEYVTLNCWCPTWTTKSSPFFPGSRTNRPHACMFFLMINTFQYIDWMWLYWLVFYFMCMVHAWDSRSLRKDQYRLGLQDWRDNLVFGGLAHILV